MNPVVLYCPRCDRQYTEPVNGTNRTIVYLRLLEKLKQHVMLQHPDHDPEWYDTYPTLEQVKDENATVQKSQTS